MMHQNITSPTFLAFDYIIDVFLLIDIIIELNCAYMELDGSIIIDHKKIFFRYLHFWLVIDILSIFPFEIFNYKNTVNNYKYFPSYYYNDLVKLFRVSKLYSRIKLNANILDFTRIKGSSLRLLKFIYMVFIGLHIMACLWY